jgi:hypothetical protein
MLKIYIENNTIYKKAFAEYAVRTWYCKIVGEACCAPSLGILPKLASKRGMVNSRNF